MAVCKDCEHYKVCLVHCSESVLRNRGICEHFEQGWISVNDGSPKDEGSFCKAVNVYTDDGKVMPGFCNHGHWYAMLEENDYCDDKGFGEVTHWKPLPEPPKEE